MRILFFTDPHIGLVRSSHTTQASQKMMREFLYNEVMTMLDLKQESMGPQDQTICLGDLFDTYSNKEDIVSQGATVASRCNYVLAGNHDIKNNVTTLGSLQLLQKLEIEDQPMSAENSKFIINPDGTKPYCRNVELTDELSLMFIPHCFTQESFEQSLDMAIAQRKKHFTILCLHCNVGEGFGHAEADSTTLYLTEEMKSKVNKSFDLCFVGHEHEPKQHKNIVTLGNFFPVSFGEIASRYVYWFDTETMKWDKELIFGDGDQYAKFEVYDLLESGGEIEVPVPLVEFTGKIEASTYPDLSRALLKFWRTNEDVLFSVKNSVEVERPDNVGRQKNSSGARMSLADIVKGSAKRAGFDEELSELTAQIERDSDG